MKSLRELQEADNEIAKLRRERGKLDDGSTARSERDTLQSAHDQALAELKNFTSQRTAQEDDQRAIEEKIARSNARLMTASSAHEVSALERDLKGLSARRGEFDDTILNLMDEVETATATHDELSSQLAQAVAHASEIEVTFHAECVRLEAELVQAVKHRDEIETRIVPTTLAKYKDFFSRFHGVAVAHLDKGNCSACGMALTPFNLKEAKTREWPTCESCGRLLYIEH